MARNEDAERPFEGGAQPVKERPPEAPTGIGAFNQTIAIVLAVLALVAAIVWLAVPFGG